MAQVLESTVAVVQAVAHINALHKASLSFPQHAATPLRRASLIISARWRCPTLNTTMEMNGTSFGINSGRCAGSRPYQCPPQGLLIVSSTCRYPSTTCQPDNFSTVEMPNAKYNDGDEWHKFWNQQWPLCRQSPISMPSTRPPYRFLNMPLPLYDVPA